MRYPESIEYLYGLTYHGIKLGLNNPVRLLSLLGNPERSFRSVHIAGTNGKGSTAAMTASMLQEAGLLTGLFTSPHLIRFTERVQVNGEEIAEDDVVRLTGLIRKGVEGEDGFSPTFFEFITAMAFLYFRERGVQWAVVETGLGGRFDATNVIAPEVTVITPVGIDHREFLGDTLSEIAYEKAGIIKEGVPLVLGPQRDEALSTIMNVAVERGVRVYTYGVDFQAEIKETNPEGVTFDYLSTDQAPKQVTTMPLLHVPLTGSYQAVNAAMAVKSFELIHSSGFPWKDIDGIIRSGLNKTRWHGRCELITYKGVPFLLDGSHNPEAAEALSRTILDVYLPERFKDVILVTGIMSDKDIKGILTPLLPIAREVILTAPAYGRSARPDVLLRTSSEILNLTKSAESAGTNLHTSSSISDAIVLAESLYRRGDLILITGSFYTVGEAKEVLGEKPSFADLREVR